MLAKLDSAALEEDRTAQMITCSNSEATVIQAKNVFDTAVIAKEEYLSGTFAQEERTAMNELFVAQEELSRAEEYYRYSQTLAGRGYMTALQLKADGFAVDKAKNALKLAETKLEVLRKFTREKMLMQLESDIKTAEAQLKAAEASHKLDTDRLKEIEGQIEKCTIRAPQAGQVVYANVIGWRGSKEVVIDAGEQVRERQVIIRLPDPNDMQVLARVNESKVGLVRPGMPATIRLDAFADKELVGNVEKVNEFPLPGGMFSSSVKEYETTVKIHGTTPGLKPGLTAEVKILIERLTNVISVPVQSVFEHGGKFYAVMRDPGPEPWRAQEIQLGATNDKFVVVTKGLKEGDEIVLNGAAYREKVALPELPTEQRRGDGRGKGRPGSGSEGKPGRPVEGGEAPGAPAAPPREPAAAARNAFQQFDKNSDGKLDPDEVPDRMRSAMADFDANHDGFIDRGEWSAAAASIRRERPGGGGRPPDGPPERK